jgi:hypothetical protein
MKYVEGITEIIHYDHSLSKKEISDIYKKQCIEHQRKERREKLKKLNTIQAE